MNNFLVILIGVFCGVFLIIAIRKIRLFVIFMAIKTLEKSKMKELQNIRSRQFPDFFLSGAEKEIKEKYRNRTEELKKQRQKIKSAPF
ncbi:MAG: hypothetical protein QMD86_00680 [Patescibacteria group bacterium]|nr:hypothetical protein [Patescibacteria group bacterium]